MVNVGIDIGTSNTVVALVNADGVADVFRFSDGYAVPSVVYVDPLAGRTVVGRLAEDEWADRESNPDFAFRRWKLRMGEDATLATLPFGPPEQRVLSPERLTTLLIEHVVGAMTNGVGGESVESVVVTVPHGWRREHPAKCVATREAAGEAVVSGTLLRVQERAVDEPVAAAAYWLHGVDNRHEFVGRTVLVVDIGGGTFDLSLIEVGERDEPLVVIDAINNNTAGDYVSALLLGQAIGVLNEQTGSQHPTDPEVLLAEVAQGRHAWLRKAFLDMQREVQDQSTGIRSAESRNRPISEAGRQVHLTGPDDTEATFRQSAAATLRLLEPFYESGRQLLRHFLGLQAPEHLPYAVVFAGGGSRIGGMASQIVRPVLAECLDDPDAVMSRIPLNEGRVDQAIALGAALVADGRISIEERLLYDIGMIFHIPGGLAPHLGLGSLPQRCIVSPLLPRGSVLPSHFRTQESGFPSVATPRGDHLECSIVVFDDPADPWLRHWTSDHPTDGEVAGVDVEVHANADGVLNVTVRAADGESVTVGGELQRNRRLRTSHLLTFEAPRSGAALPPIVTPEQLVEAYRGWGRNA